MLTDEQARANLLSTLRSKSVFHGDFTLSSGAKSKFYIDCRLTTLDASAAWLVGQLVHRAIRTEEKKRGLKINCIGGLTMGADPIAVATGMVSANEGSPLQVFVVRKAPKGHGQTKLIEGNFKSGDTVVIVDDVVTKGDSTLTAINAVEKEGGKVAFVVVLVDRQEGGKKAIEDRGYSVVSLFTKENLLAAN